MAAIEAMTTTKNRWAHIAASYREPQARRSIAQAGADGSGAKPLEDVRVIEPGGERMGGQRDRPVSRSVPTSRPSPTGS